MKINILQDTSIRETEIIVRCNIIDKDIEKILAAVRLIDCVLVGKDKNETFFVPANEIYYFETVDNKTFFYTKETVLETQLRLFQIEEKLLKTSFVKANKSTIINLKKVKSLKSTFNSRIIAALFNGEKIIISRQYMKNIKQKLGM